MKLKIHPNVDKHFHKMSSMVVIAEASVVPKLNDATIVINVQIYLRI